MKMSWGISFKHGTFSNSLPTSEQLSSWHKARKEQHGFPGITQSPVAGFMLGVIKNWTLNDDDEEEELVFLHCCPLPERVPE